jgi:hypothetical protein
MECENREDRVDCALKQSLESPITAVEQARMFADLLERHNRLADAADE